VNLGQDYRPLNALKRPDTNNGTERVLSERKWRSLKTKMDETLHT